MASGPIDLAEARDALLRSGYLLESRVETLLGRRGFHAEANAAFPDRTTGVSRELDVDALSAVKAGPGRIDYLWPRLLIECVNNPQPLVLITKLTDSPAQRVLAIQASGVPLKFAVGEEWVPMSEFLNLASFHHYCRGRVATQYCSFQQKKQPGSEWMAWHDEMHFDSFKKVCHAVEYATDDHFTRWRFVGPEPLNVVLYYPIVVVQGRLLEARPRARAEEVALYDRKHLMLRRTEFIGGNERTFQIDVVQERGLPRFVSMINQETERIARALRRRHRAARESINAIIRSARRRAIGVRRDVMTGTKILTTQRD